MGDTLLNSRDFDVSKSPGKVDDMEIEKMMDELGKMNADDEWAWAIWSQLTIQLLMPPIQSLSNNKYTNMDVVF